MACPAAGGESWEGWESFGAVKRAGGEDGGWGDDKSKEVKFRK